MRPGPQLRVANLVLIADRLDWPAGAIGHVLKLGEDFPGWRVTWSAGGQQLWREPGYYAWPLRRRAPYRDVTYDKDPARLREVLELCPAPDPRNGWAPPGGWLP